jgi:hypothetical protein
MVVSAEEEEEELLSALAAVSTDGGRSSNVVRKICVFGRPFDTQKKGDASMALHHPAPPSKSENVGSGNSGGGGGGNGNSSGGGGGDGVSALQVGVKDDASLHPFMRSRSNMSTNSGVCGSAAADDGSSSVGGGGEGLRRGASVPVEVVVFPPDGVGEVGSKGPRGYHVRIVELHTQVLVVVEVG